MQVDGTNIRMIRGDSETILVQCAARDGVPYAFEEGDRLYFTIKRSEYAKEKLLQKVVDSFAADGSASILLFPEDTKALAFGSYRYDLQLTTKDGRVITIIPPSCFKLCKEVTYE